MKKIIRAGLFISIGLSSVLSLGIGSVLSLVISSGHAFAAPANESNTSSQAKSSKVNKLIIESTIQGSQVQPNVIYITPWQELDTPIEIEEKELTVTLPVFKPINPKEFKQQVKQYY